MILAFRSKLLSVESISRAWALRILLSDVEDLLHLLWSFLGKLTWNGVNDFWLQTNDNSSFINQFECSTHGLGYQIWSLAHTELLPTSTLVVMPGQDKVDERLDLQLLMQLLGALVFILLVFRALLLRQHKEVVCKQSVLTNCSCIVATSLAFYRA